MTNQKTISIKFDRLEEFEKDVKTLLKRYRSIEEDLSIIEAVLRIRPDEAPPFSYRMDNLKLETCVIKVKKIACKSLKGKGVMSGLRLIYAYFELEERIVYVELFHKNDKPNEDRERIKRNFE